jgi:hypothetical protein
MTAEAEDNPATESEPVTGFEQSRKETRRAQWALNILVVFSAVAGSVFFFYVLYTIQLFGSKDPPPVEVPTSSVGAKFGLLVGEDATTGVSAVLRDIDEAPSYREKLSDVMRRDVGIQTAGRVYLFAIRNDGKGQVQINATSLVVRDDKGTQWTVQWLEQAARPDTASATGKLRLAQSKHNFELGAGEERQLYVFIPSSGDSLPPSAEDLASGTLIISGGIEISLTHTEMKAVQQ